MSRFLTVALAAVSLFALAGCGNSTMTVKFTSTAGSISMVVSGSQDGMDKLKQKMSSELSSAGSDAGQVTTVDGDQHVGNKVCETDVTDSGSTYHVIVYGSVPGLDSSICSSIQSGA